MKSSSAISSAIAVARSKAKATVVIPKDIKPRIEWDAQYVENTPFEGCCLFNIAHEWPESCDSEATMEYDNTLKQEVPVIYKNYADADFQPREVTLAALTDDQIVMHAETLKNFIAVTPRLQNPSSKNWITLFMYVGKEVKIDDATKADKAFTAKVVAAREAKPAFVK